MREQFSADQLRVGADGVAGVGGDDVAGQRVVPVQREQQRRELRHLVRLRAGQPSGEHDAGAVGDGGQQVRDQAVLAGRAAHGLAVDRDGRQPSRSRDGAGDRAGQRAQGQVRPCVMRERLRAQAGEDPYHRVRVRRHADPQRIPAGAAAARTSCGAACTQAVTSSIAVFPLRTAAVHKASTPGRECRTPCGSRGSGTAAKHSSRFSPDAAVSAAARETIPASASAAAAGTGMPDWTGNGTSRQRRDVSNPLP